MRSRYANQLSDEERTCLKLVSQGLQARDDDNAIIARLLKAGISQSEALRKLDLIRHAIRNGVNAAFTKGLSSHAHEISGSLIGKAAFEEGYRTFRRKMRWIFIRRFIVILGLALSIVIIILLLTR